MSLTTLLVALSLIAAGACGGMAFTDWGRRRPLHRYGALSIAGHLLLLGWMASVRVGGPPQAGADDAPPMRVRIVARAAAPTTTTAPRPAESAPPPRRVVAEAVAPSPVARSESAEPLEAVDSEVRPAPPAAVAPQAKPVDETLETRPAPASPSIDPEPRVVEPLTPETAAPRSALVVESPVPAPPVPEPPSADAWTSPEVAPPEAPTPAARSPLLPSAYALRGEVGQRRLSADEGGSAETLDAVAAAVDWLARAQRADGAWDAARWGAGRETHTLDQDRRGAGRGAETGLTGLALLAMGGAGHTHLAGPYRDSVTSGLQFLLNTQEPTGAITGDATLYAKTYCHSMATFALAEAMAVSRDERLRPAVESAVGYLVRSQSRADGGWRYQPGDRGDMSQMGWVVMALRSAEIAGVAIPPATWSGCERFIDGVRAGPDGGLASYQPRGRPTGTMTAEAMYCRQILGVAPRADRARAEAVAMLLDDLPGSRQSPSSPGGKPNLYYWYYATLALHHHSREGAEARDAWRDWNEALRRTLLPRQVADGPQGGSWGADTVWGGYGGRVYSTALAAMCLEVYYRYDPETIGRDPWIAARGGALRR